MALKQPSLYNKIVGTFALGLLLVVFVHVLDYQASEELIKSFHEVDAMHQIVLRLEETESLLKDVQRAHRGYILSEQEEFLQPYTEAIRQLPVLLQLLEQDLQHHVPQQADFVLLKQLVARNVALANNAIQQVRSGEKEKAMQDIALGKRYFDRLNQLLTAMKGREEKHLAVTWHQAEYYSNKNRLVVLLALISSSLLLLFALWRIVRDLNSINSLRVAVAGANDDLTAYNEELVTINQALENNQNSLLAAQQALEEREQQLLEAQAISKTGSFNWQIAENKVRFTPQYASMFRIGEGEPYTYQDFLSRLHPDDRGRVNTVLTESIKNNLPYDIEYRISFPDQLLHVHVIAKPYYKNGTAAGILGTVADITAFKEAQAKLQAEEERFRALLESAPDAMIVTNSDGTIALTNKQAEKLLGFSREEMQHKQLITLLPERYHNDYQEYKLFSAQPKASGKRLVRDMWICTRSGAEIPVEISLSPIKARESVLMAAAIRDISTRKEAEKQLQEAYQALKRANTELDTFSYSVSHDLRAPLRAISGYSSILKEEFGEALKQEGSRLVDIIRQNATRMGALITDLLEFAKLGKRAVRKSTFDMHALVQQVLADKQLKKGTEVRLEPLAPAQGDPVLLRQVWENLINNAIKFSRNREVPEITISCRKESNRNVYCIKDNGAGFDPAYAQDLFQVFKRLHADTEFEGTGAGLAIVRRIVEGHSGEIWAVSQPGEGATFYFSLPVEEA